MKHIVSIFILCTILSAEGCKKDAADNDLTTDIAGHYTNTAIYADIVVNRIDDTHVSIAVDGYGNGMNYYVATAFSNVTMNSKTSFTLNSASATNIGCEGTITYTGTGTASNNNISLFITATASNVGANDPCNSGNATIAASK